MEIEKVPASIGLICESIEKGDQSYHDWITDKQETGLFEFWNHGLDHSKGSENGAPYWEFRNQSREKQQKHLLYAQKLASEKLGLELVTFGAPYNQSDQVTAEVLEEIKEIKNWLYPPSGVTTSKTRLERLRGVNIEYPVHNPSSYQFWNNFYFNSNTELLVIQGHPNSWDERRFHEFEGIIQYLKLLNLEVILPRDLQQKS
jgi:hypothetical protein